MRINLPQLEITANAPQQAELLLVSGGRQPSSCWLRQIAENKSIWCADHGIDICKSADIVPERLIGDNDSASPESLIWAKEHSIKVDVFPPEKDFTDTQLALNMISKESTDNVPFVFLTGAFGGRLDHLISTAFSFATSSINGIIADDKEFLLPLTGPSSITIKFFTRPKAISLLPLCEKCFNITTNGLKWELNNSLLLQSAPYAVSNELKKDTDTIRISILTGIIGIYAFWE